MINQEGTIDKLGILLKEFEGRERVQCSNEGPVGPVLISEVRRRQLEAWTQLKKKKKRKIKEDLSPKQ